MWLPIQLLWISPHPTLLNTQHQHVFSRYLPYFLFETVTNDAGILKDLFKKLWKPVCAAVKIMSVSQNNGLVFVCHRSESILWGTQSSLWEICLKKLEIGQEFGSYGSVRTKHIWKKKTLQYIFAFCTKHTLANCQGLMTADNQHGKSVFLFFKKF